MSNWSEGDMGREGLKEFSQFISSLFQNHLKQNIEK